MQFSHHAGQRMNQRGISRRLVELTLNKKQVLDKGGVAVVEGDDTIITAYNHNVPPARARDGGHIVRICSNAAGIQSVTDVAEI